jgi:hypothetical protein
MNNGAVEAAMGLFNVIGTIAGILVLGAVGTGVYLYATDYKIQATVQETDCAAGEVVVETKLFSITHTVKDVPFAECSQLAPGSFVEYYLRSQRTTLYASEGGPCIYDTKTGVRCGQGF